MITIPSAPSTASVTVSFQGSQQADLAGALENAEISVFAIPRTAMMIAKASSV